MNQTEHIQKVQDDSHVRLLVIFHCIYGGLTALAGIGLIIFAILMGSFVSSAVSGAGRASTWTSTSSSSTSPPAGDNTWATTDNASFATFPTSSTYLTTSAGGTSSQSAQPMDVFDNFMNIYLALYALAGLLALILGALCFVSARKMSQRRGQTFSLLIAGLNCLSFPMGTLLGVFTFIILLRPSITATYQPDDTHQQFGHSQQ